MLTTVYSQLEERVTVMDSSHHKVPGSNPGGEIYLDHCDFFLLFTCQFRITGF